MRVISASLCCFFYCSAGVNRLRAGRSLSFLAKKKVTKESCLGIGEELDAPTGLRSLRYLSSHPRRSHRICSTRTLEIWDIGAPTASRPAGCRRTDSRRGGGFAPDLGAAVDQTLPTPEREAVGERASRFTCNEYGWVINSSRPGREGNAVERSPDHRSCDSPLPGQLSLVAFFFARKESYSPPRDKWTPPTEWKKKVASEAEVAPP